MFYLYHDYGPIHSAARQCPISVGKHFATRGEAVAAWNTRAVPPQATLAQGKAAMVLVPREATEEMIDAGVTADHGSTLGDRVENCYRAMLAAAPSTTGMGE